MDILEVRIPQQIINVLESAFNTEIGFLERRRKKTRFYPKLYGNPACGWNFASTGLTMLTRISHQLSTAAADPGMSTALRSVGLLDVLSSTPAEPSRRAPCSHARLRRLATKPGEKCGLMIENTRKLRIMRLSRGPERQNFEPIFSDITCYLWPETKVRMCCHRRAKGLTMNENRLGKVRS
jgi:hypothetical protein